MRGCDANAALYWMSRMLLGGEDPLYVARRLIEFASADIGESSGLPKIISKSCGSEPQSSPNT